MSDTALTLGGKRKQPEHLRKYWQERRAEEEKEAKKTPKNKGLGAPAKKTTPKGKNIGEKALTAGGQILAGTAGFLVGEQIYKALLSDDPNATEFGSWLELAAGLGILIFAENEFLQAGGIGLALNGGRHLIVKMDPTLAGAVGGNEVKKMPPVKMYRPTLADEGMTPEAVENGKTYKEKEETVGSPPNEYTVITPENEDEIRAKGRAILQEVYKNDAAGKTVQAVISDENGNVVKKFNFRTNRN